MLTQSLDDLPQPVATAIRRLLLESAPIVCAAFLAHQAIVLADRRVLIVKGGRYSGLSPGDKATSILYRRIRTVHVITGNLTYLSVSAGEVYDLDFAADLANRVQLVRDDAEAVAKRIVGLCDGASS